MQKWAYKSVFEKKGEGSYVDGESIRGRKISALSWEAFEIDEVHEDPGSQRWELVGFISELNGTPSNDDFKRPIEV